MSIFAPHNIEVMNEDDVSGEIVRPFCRALGYSVGDPSANLRSQVQVRYDKTFLGHKDADRDPILRGRPDFVCEVVSYTRWVIEAKAPSIALSLSDSEQAHTYATHPEIAAEFYVLTNGREFRLYRVAKPEEPIWVWSKEDVDDLLPSLRALLGPEAMKKRADVKIDKGKPLTDGWRSSMDIVGGHIVYQKNTTSLGVNLNIDGLVNSVSGVGISRNDDGLIEGIVELKSSYDNIDELFKAFGIYPLRFKTSSEYLSADKEKPTLLQNMFKLEMPRGMTFPKSGLSPGGVLPVTLRVTCYVEAAAFVDGTDLRGTFIFKCDYEVVGARHPLLPPSFDLVTEGTFDVRVR